MPISNHDDGPDIEAQPLRILTESKFGRRMLLGSAVSATSMMMLPLVQPARAAQEEVRRALSANLMAILESFVDTILPADDSGPGAVAAGAADYIDHTLADWNAGELAFISEGLSALDDYASRRFGSVFTVLPAQDRDAVLLSMEAGQAEGFANSQALFSRLHRLTLEGTFSDPYYGGNRNYIGWDLIGYPGAVMASTPEMQRMGGRVPPLHTSAYGADYDGD